MSATRGKLTLLGLVVLVLAGLGGGLGWVSTRSGGPPAGPSAGYRMMGPGGSRPAWYLEGSGRPVTDLADARARARRFAARLGLETGEVMRFADTFYVLLEERSGRPATEVLVDPQTGAVTLEYGPAMMWNTRYGMTGSAAAVGAGGMMGGGGAGAAGMMGTDGGTPNWTPPQGSVHGPLTIVQARRLANRWLAAEGSGLTAGEPRVLPGYVTFHTAKGGKITGMLSVNLETGAVWYHWWHGRFVAMEE